MSDKSQKLFKYHKNAATALIKLRGDGYSFLELDSIYQILIYQLDCTEVYTEIIHKELSSDEMVYHIKEFFKTSGLPIGSVVFDIEDEEDGRNLNALEKAIFRENGSVWIIHKNDADPFPSNPHAHKLDSFVKLHLGNGKLYRKTQVYGQLPKKELERLRDKIAKGMKDIVLPVLE
ncbi:hypothetical protein SAMN05428975_0416 [Mucilaginibacter sp. OK268]|uniref:hypothetical protein n=1 Tax=Mucilaginibacter sp. OK268 TaxID=1881048 RepID=UPI00087E7E94|nr:hypothetical protein [Mucilaginibacter sp. OK268]SDP13008.1 hypothetical protein SAMN05428975_0416 [Mucilaginibacter sp. OK268]